MHQVSIYETQVALDADYTLGNASALLQEVEATGKNAQNMESTNVNSEELMARAAQLTDEARQIQTKVTITYHTTINFYYFP